MDQKTDSDLEQAYEQILSYMVSDETLEAAARTVRGTYTVSELCTFPGHGCGPGGRSMP